MQDTKLYGTQIEVPTVSEKAESFRIQCLIWLFVLGWASQEYTLLDVGKYSILLIYIVAIPFCLRTTGRSITFVMLPLVSAVLAAVVGVIQGSARPMGIVSQGALQLLAIFVASGVASIDWRKYFLSLAKTMVVIGVPLVVFGGYQMIARAHKWKFAFLPVTNQQAYALDGLQRGWEKEPFTRASSVFVEPAEFGYYCIWLMILGLSTTKGRWRFWALALAIAGILFSQSLSAFLAAALLMICYMATNPISFNLIRQVLITFIATVIAVLLFQPLAPEAYDKFSLRIQQALTLNNEADSGRVDHLPANWEMFKNAPIWGSGLSSISSAEDNGTDVTSFTYSLMLIERGLVGAVCFFVPWVWLGWRGIKMPASDPFRTPCVLLSALNLFTFAVSSVAYTLSYWFALGICASFVLHTYLPTTRFGFEGWTAWGRVGGARAVPLRRVDEQR